MLSQLSVDKFLTDKPLAITAAGLEELRGHIEARLALFDSGPREFLREMAESFAAERAAPSRGRPRSGAVGVIQIRGTISQHARGELSSLLMGGTSIDEIREQLRAYMADDEITSILLDIDSPGGSTFGVEDLAAEIRQARETKPIVAFANSTMASLAYHIGSQASQVYARAGGIVGSIGVYGIHQDISKAAETEGVKTTLISAGKFKTAGNQWEPLDDETKARMQTRVDEAYDAFVRDVARGRGVPEASVRNGYGEGDVVTAKQAKQLGMIDAITTFDQAIQKALTIRPKAAEADTSEAILQGKDSEPEREAEQIAEREAGAARLGRLRLRALQDRAASNRAVMEV